MKPLVCKHSCPGASPQQAKKQAVGHQFTGLSIKGHQVVVFVLTKSHTGDPAHLGDLIDNIEQINQIDRIAVLDLMFRPSVKKYNRIIVSLLDVQEDEDATTAIKCQGKLIAKDDEKHITPFKKENIVDNNISCIFAYIENEEPKYFNKVMGDSNAAKIIAQMYHPYLHDDSFWDNAEEIIGTHFSDQIDGDESSKIIGFGYSKMFRILIYAAC